MRRFLRGIGQSSVSVAPDFVHHDGKHFICSATMRSISSAVGSGATQDGFVDGYWAIISGV
jgi:hypothetical protein